MRQTFKVQPCGSLYYFKLKGLLEPLNNKIAKQSPDKPGNLIL